MASAICWARRDAVVLDEAHQICRIWPAVLWRHCGSRQLEALLKELRVELAVHAGGTRSGQRRAALADAEDALLQLRRERAGDHRPLPLVERRLGLEFTRRAELGESLYAMQAALVAAGEDSPLAQLAERAAEVAANLARIGAQDELDGARAPRDARRRGLHAAACCLSISPRASAPCWRRAAARGSSPLRRLSLGEDFGHFTGRLGLEDAQTAAHRESLRL